MSLQVILNNLIQNKGYVPYEEVVRVTLEEGYKVSNAERRLRRSESPKVKPIMKTSKRGTRYIGAYEWEEPKLASIPIPKVENAKLL